MEEEENRGEGKAGERRGEVKRERNKNHKRKGFWWARILGFSFIYFEIYFTVHDIKNNQCHWSCVCRAFT